jgi:iron-sulfur cluster repair protein YtfE (RIC family)
MNCLAIAGRAFSKSRSKWRESLDLAHCGELDLSMGHRHKEEKPDRIWSTAPLRELINYIISKHHAYLRAELPALEKLAGAIGPNLAGGAELAKLVACLSQDLELQMQKEETILFPAILELDAASRKGQDIGHSKFGSVRNLTKVIGRSHSQTVKAVEELRQLTNNYSPPTEANGVLGLFLLLVLADLRIPMS